MLGDNRIRFDSIIRRDDQNYINSTESIEQCTQAINQAMDYGSLSSISVIKSFGGAFFFGIRVRIVCSTFSHIYK